MEWQYFSKWLLNVWFSIAAQCGSFAYCTSHITYRPINFKSIALIHAFKWNMFVCFRKKALLWALNLMKAILHVSVRKRLLYLTILFSSLHSLFINRFNIIDITKSKCNYQQIIKTNAIFVFVRPVLCNEHECVWVLWRSSDENVANKYTMEHNLI